MKFNGEKPSDSFEWDSIPLGTVEKFIINIEVCKPLGIPELNPQLFKDAFIFLINDLIHQMN